MIKGDVMLRAIIYNKLEGASDEAIGVVYYKNKKITFSDDMPDDMLAYFRSGIPGRDRLLYPRDGLEFLESLPAFFWGKSLYVLLKD